MLKKLVYPAEELFKKKSSSVEKEEVAPPVSAQVTARVLTQQEVEEWEAEKATEVAMLRDWLKKQPHLPQNLTNEQLLVFLQSCYNSVEQTKTKIDNHFTMRTHAPEIFTSRSIQSKEVTQALRVARVSPLKIPNGHNVIFVDCVDPNVENYNLTAVLKATGMAIDTLIRYYPREDNVVLVFDMRNSVLAHVLRTNLVTLKKGMLFVQTSLPFRLTEIHVINAFPLIHQIQTMLKPFINSELSKLIHIHMQDNMDSFYKYIPKKYLPKDYGGESMSLQELNDILKKMIKEQEPYLEAVEQQKVNENKRAGMAKSSSDVFGLEGSFRKIEFD
ncbi:UNVERIFIED_CONTAM: hypothetical protein PYX00_009148 [Menopon gallinae]|uniref:CRAL-TRIO domain-containing protein n=1 Tax=Menopon gallinae TaxID=328185 RepID=A0AAW2HAI7_9NEOP